MIGEMTQRQQSSRTKREIDENLRRAYGDLANQDVPDRFTKLLDQLRKSGTPDGSKAEGDHDTK